LAAGGGHCIFDIPASDLGNKRLFLLHIFSREVIASCSHCQYDSHADDWMAFDELQLNTL
jgi:hypothetical protein